jgi:hypothetical protein
VILGSRRLTDGQKHVWLQLHALDRGDQRGAWVGAVALSECVGRPVETVERQRRELQELGLLQRVDVARGKGAYWYVRLPDECIPASRAPAVAEVRILVSALDQHLAGVGSPVTPPGRPEQERRDTTPPSPVTPPFPQERAERGVTGDPTPARGDAPPLPSPLKQVGENLQLQVGDVALAPGEKQENGNDSEPGRGDSGLLDVAKLRALSRQFAKDEGKRLAPPGEGNA